MGIIFNLFICFSISAFSNITKIDIYRSHRQKFHDFLNEHMGLHPSRTKLRSFAYGIALIWLFFGVGPGQVLGNNFLENLVQAMKLGFLKYHLFGGIS